MVPRPFRRGLLGLGPPEGHPRLRGVRAALWAARRFPSHLRGASAQEGQAGAEESHQWHLVYARGPPAHQGGGRRGRRGQSGAPALRMS